MLGSRPTREGAPSDKFDYPSRYRVDPGMPGVSWLLRRGELMNALSIQLLTGIISTANVSALLINKSILVGSEC